MRNRSPAPHPLKPGPTRDGARSVLITLTEDAQKAVRGFQEQDAALRARVLRISVKGGGCSGFQYGFAFSERREGDSVVPCEGFDVVVDPTSRPYLEGCVVDYREGLLGAGFSVSNPSAAGCSGCGQSFSS